MPLSRDRETTRSPDQDGIRFDGGSGGDGGTIVGLRSANGIVVVADARVSADTGIESESIQKIQTVHPTAVLGSPGHPGPAKEVIRSVDRAADRYELDRGRPMDIPALKSVVMDEIRARNVDGQFVLAGVDDQGPHIYTISPDQGALAHGYVAIGTGMQAAYGKLDSVHVESLTLEEARNLAIRAIRSAAERDVHTGPGGHVAEVTDAGVSLDAIESFDTPA